MFMWLWRFFIGGCNHRWQILDRALMTNEGKCVGKIFILRCEECGDIKKEAVSVYD